MSDSTKTDEMIELLLARAELARRQEATRRSDNTSAYIFLSVILLIICAGIGGVLFVGPDKVLAMVRGNTQQADAPVIEPTALPIRSNPASGNVGTNRGNTSQQTTIIVQPTDVPLPAVDVQPAQSEMVVTDSGAVLPAPTAVPTVDTAAILAQGNGPIATTPTPEPTGAYALAPDFAPLVLGQPTVKPTPASMYDWKK